MRNIEASPRVRVKVGRRWRPGTAHVLPDEDPAARLRALGGSRAARLNVRTVERNATEMLVIRVDLDRA